MAAIDPLTAGVPVDLPPAAALPTPPRGGAVSAAEDAPRDAPPAPEPEDRPEPKEPLDLTNGTLREAIDGLNTIMSVLNRSLHFQIHEDSGRTLTEVVQTETGEVIKTIPPEELLKTLSRIMEAVGLLIDTDG